MSEQINPRELQPIIATLLESVDVFADLKPLELARLLQDAEQCRYATGDIILQEGSEGRSFYVIFSGSVQVCKGAEEGARQEIARLNQAQCFGEMSLVDNNRRSADVIAISPCTLLCIDEDILWLHPLASARIFRNIARILAYRLRETNAMAMWWQEP
jgi:CRP-like cAMP-binding protein